MMLLLSPGQNSTPTVCVPKNQAIEQEHRISSIELVSFGPVTPIAHGLEAQIPLLPKKLPKGCYNFGQSIELPL
jgi:hypothetical protein